MSLKIPLFSIYLNNDYDNGWRFENKPLLNSNNIVDLSPSYEISSSLIHILLVLYYCNDNVTYSRYLDKVKIKVEVLYLKSNTYWFKIYDKNNLKLTFQKSINKLSG